MFVCDILIESAKDIAWLLRCRDFDKNHFRYELNNIHSGSGFFVSYYYDHFYS